MSNEKEKPFLSIVLAIESSYHLSSLTLQSIVSQTEKDYEIIVVEKGGTKQDLHHLKDYTDVIKRIFSTHSVSLSHLFNKGLSLASGEYVQFVLPGDVYLAETSLGVVKIAMQKQNYPDLFITSLLRRMENLEPEVQDKECSVEVLKRGVIPSRLSCCYFKKSLLQAHRGFSKTITRREGFDLFCRILTSENPTIGRLRQVVMDTEVPYRTPKEIALFLFETLKLLKKHFGLMSAVKWFFYYDHCRSLLWLYRSLVQVFLKNA